MKKKHPKKYEANPKRLVVSGEHLSYDSKF